MESSAKERIEQEIKDNKIMIFMKGTPDVPQCGFSAQAVSILKEYHVAFGCFDVLSDDDVRQGIKEYSDWPTIPQLYVNGQFIGGCDVMTEMHKSGDLEKILK